MSATWKLTGVVRLFSPVAGSRKLSSGAWNRTFLLSAPMVSERGPGGRKTAVSRPLPLLQDARGYAKGAKAPKGGKSGKRADTATMAELDMEVCRGANVYKNGDDPPIREPSEYPSWLWSLLAESQDLSPDTKQYWRRLNKSKAHERNMLKRQSH